MNVFEFEKSLLTRLEESRNVLQCKDTAVPASEIRREWAYHVELQIEPAGWQSLWKISRVVCERLHIKYPTIVFGTVTNVLFDELLAEFSVIGVQDDDVHIPQFHTVPLEDLWPTVDQENPELNIDRTADCIDELRFFYRNIWMPWDNDNDDDLDWCEKHLESRIRLCFDLKHDMSRPMADHIRILLTEARYIQSRREIIEVEMSDDDELDEATNQNQVTDLMRMHLRLAVIRNEIELLENPEMRKIYEEVRFKAKSEELKSTNAIGKSSNVYIVTKDDTIAKQMEFLEAAKAFVDANKIVKIISSLKDCFKLCASADQIFVPSGRHTIKFLEPLNSNGFLKAIESNTRPAIQNGIFDIADEELNANALQKAIIVSEDNDSTLLVFNGDYTIENIWFDCRNVRLGLWCRNGTIKLKNCRIIGDKSSSTANGIVVADEATCMLENSIVQDFANGITCGAGGKVILKQATIVNCRIGLDFNDGSNVESEQSKILNCIKYGLFYETSNDVLETEGKKMICANVEDLQNVLKDNCKTAVFTGECTFNGNKNGNIAIFNHEKLAPLQNSAFIEDTNEVWDDISFADHELSDDASTISNNCRICMAGNAENQIVDLLDSSGATDC